jgi:hypothetical protein
MVIGTIAALLTTYFLVKVAISGTKKWSQLKIEFHNWMQNRGEGFGSKIPADNIINKAKTDVENAANTLRNSGSVKNNFQKP